MEEESFNQSLPNKPTSSTKTSRLKVIFGVILAIVGILGAYLGLLPMALLTIFGFYLIFIDFTSFIYNKSSNTLHQFNKR